MIKARTFFGEKTGGAQLTPGIHSAVEFGGIEVVDNRVSVTYEKDGSRVKQSLFSPAGAFQFGDETPEAATKRATYDNGRHLTLLMRVILGDVVAREVEAEDYDSFVQKVSDLLNPHIGFKVNLKLVPGRREGYISEVPRYASEPYYIEPYIDGQAPTLLLSTKEQDALDAWVNNNRE